jgi:outer membrane immunogenic protein
MDDPSGRRLSPGTETVMKSALTASLASLLFAGAVIAGDLPSGKYLPPVPELPSFYSWTGFYLGGQVGYSWERDRVREFSAPTRFATGYGARFSSDTALAGGHAGFNYQMGSVVVGIEGDVEAVNARGRFTDALGTGATRRDWQASLRGRIGYAFDRVLVYGTAGAAFSEFEFSYRNGATGLAERLKASKTGWTAGLGIAYAFTDAVIVGIEYRYTDYGRFDHVGLGAFAGLIAEQEPTMQAVRASLGYKF